MWVGRQTILFLLCPNEASISSLCFTSSVRAPVCLLCTGTARFIPKTRSAAATRTGQNNGRRSNTHTIFVKLLTLTSYLFPYKYAIIEFQYKMNSLKSTNFVYEFLSFPRVHFHCLAGICLLCRKTHEVYIRRDR